MKVNAQDSGRALQIAATIASNHGSGLSQGVLGSAEVEAQTCLQGLRLVPVMRWVMEQAGEHPELLGACPRKARECLYGLVAKAKKEASKPVVEEPVESEEPTDQGTGGDPGGE